MCVLFSFNVLSFDSILDGKLMEQGGESASSPSAGCLLRPINDRFLHRVKIS